MSYRNGSRRDFSHFLAFKRLRHALGSAAQSLALGLRPLVSAFRLCPKLLTPFVLKASRKDVFPRSTLWGYELLRLIFIIYIT